MYLDVNHTVLQSALSQRIDITGCLKTFHSMTSSQKYL